MINKTKSVKRECLSDDYNKLFDCLWGLRATLCFNSSTIFFVRISFHSEYGVPTAKEEGENIGKSLKDKDVLFMMNHGNIISLNTELWDTCS